MKSILITGGTGYIARALYDELKDNYIVTLLTRNDFDMTDFISMNRFFGGKYFDTVIHCATKGGSRLKRDAYRDMDTNLIMYYNLLQHKHHFGKLINFGSGAEIYAANTPYGSSKQTICNSISETDGFFNIRIFAVFNQNELETRFIKSNITRYINRESISINENKLMDFFYMNDLFILVKYYIDTDSKKLPKTSECSYKQKHTLCDIASMINSLSDYTVSVEVNSDIIGNPYIGSSDINLNYIGLEKGIKITYEHLLKRKK